MAIKRYIVELEVTNRMTVSIFVDESDLDPATGVVTTKTAITEVRKTNDRRILDAARVHITDIREFCL